MSEIVLHIVDNKIANKIAIRNQFNSLADGKYLLRIEAFKKRSLEQNAYYWGVVVPLVREGLRGAGYNEVKSNDDAHEVMKHLFLKRRIISEQTGDLIDIAGSTANLKTVVFNAFLEDIWKWAAEFLNVQIPMPNEQMIMFAEFDNSLNATIVE